MKIDKYFHLWADKTTIYFDEVEPIENRPRGEWIDKHATHCECSNCGEWVAKSEAHNYCTYCGAEMEDKLRWDI